MAVIVWDFGFLEVEAITGVVTATIILLLNMKLKKYFI